MEQLHSLLPTIVSDLLPLVLFVAIAWLRPDLFDRCRFGSRMDHLGGKAPIIAALATFALGWGLSTVRPALPEIHDEYSYLLASDTFASGRLTNPRPEHWRAFEVPQVLTTPTRQSRYPPSKGLLLALGQKLTGLPIVGVWLGMAGASAALVWSLQARFSTGWALFGGMLPAVRFGIFKWDANLSWAYWLESYWGGELGLLGGALVFGSAFRLLRSPSKTVAAVFGIGAAVLAANRPYEGLLLVGLVVVVLLLRIPASPAFAGRIRVMLPALVAPVSALLGLCAYSYVVVENPLTMPHAVYTSQYQYVGHFVFSDALDPEFKSDSRIGRFHKEFGPARLADHGGSMPRLRFSSMALQGGFFLGAVLLLLWPALALDLRNDAVWLPLVALLVTVLGHTILAVGTVHQHYYGPVAPAFVFLSVAAGVRTSKWRPGSRPVGRAVALSAVVGCFLTLLVSVTLRASFYEPVSRWPSFRDAIAKDLIASPGPDLVFVTYGPKYLTSSEWVYNEADLDTTEIVWAHDLGAADNLALVAHFPGRAVWRLTLKGGEEPQLTRYEEQASDQ